MFTEPLTCRKSEGMEDWYVIERKNHDGQMWFEPTGPHSASLRCSSRIGNADIEGTREEMLAIAAAIKAGGSVGFKRCSAKTVPEGVLMASPRNGIEPTLVSHEVAMALADEILRSLASTVRDAVLEEAAKEANVCASGCLECATEAAFAARIRALKSQPADKGKE